VFYYPVLACPLSQRADTPRSGSGNGPERALKAITKSPSAQRESPILPRASSASAGPIPRSAKTRQAAAGSVRSEPWRRTPKPLAHSAKTQSFPEPPQRAQDRSRGAPHTPSGAGSVHSEPWRRTPKPLAHSAKAQSSPEPSCERRTDAAEPTTLPKHRANNRPTTAPLNPRVLSGNSAPLIYGTREVAHSWTR
jgi:hypothetical protein